MSTSLKSFNTFGIAANAAQLIHATTHQELVTAWQQTSARNLPVLILGEGSNVLLLEDFTGTVILNRIAGIEVTENDDAWYIHVGAGENWHHLVEYTLDKGISGLENLALIPGCAGSAPIQNIGAYGIEFHKVCEYVDYVELVTGELKRLSAEACRFGYRDSIFKHELQNRVAIVAIGLKLVKNWQPILTYGDLTALPKDTVTAHMIFDSVCQMRMSKLPDPRVQGNAGSFFKNPIVAAEVAAQIRQAHPNAPQYPQPDGSVKLAAGWLIDHCQLKGYQVGDAAVHQRQALVLVNLGDATSGNVVQLAHDVRLKVAQQFNVWLEPEVRFIGPQGEVSAVETIA